jgi:signal transduction histidine kinase
MRHKPWIVLVGGFGGLLILMAIGGTAVFLSLRDLRANSARAQQHYFSRNRALEKIRSHVYLSGTFVRDYLLAPEPSGARAQLAALDGLHRQTQTVLDEYARSLEASEVAPFEALKTEIEAYWKVLDHTFEWTPEERSKFRSAFFYEQLIPRRTSMLQIADRVAEVNERELRANGEQLSRLFDRLQFGLAAMAGTMLLGGAALAAGTILHVLRLEKVAQLRYQESLRSQASLQELSAKLVRAQEEERRAISRELHDEVGQAFSAVVMEAENLLDLHPGEEQQARLESIRRLAQKGVDEIRNMSLLLRPSMLDDFGLVPTLNWQARETAKRTGLRIQVVANELAEKLPEEHTTCIYRVVQEALTNCARHAQASAVQVAVQGQAHRILLTVQDDGSGFDPARVRGLGLLGMEERVRHLGGAFDIDSHPGRGTVIQVELPLTSLTSLGGEYRNGFHSHIAG